VNFDDYATADEAADLLGIERRSLYTYVRRLKGFPQPVKVGRTLLFDRESLLGWRAKHPARQRHGHPPPRDKNTGKSAR
jgi:predicted DNA-binding transcriptional regulator AlpA